MEGCPRLPALSFDLKLSMESVNLCEKIPNYIKTNYQENAENFMQECDQINRLRQTATSCSIDETGIQWLKRYYCQLQLLRNRFPMLPDTECSVRFTWEDGFQAEENTSNDVRFEEASILYNIGAMYSKLGAQETRKSHESIKNACTYYRYAAACFEKVRDQYTPYSLDFTTDLLTCQVDTLLAQAHEAVLEKSLLDQRPPSVNAHIAMQISDYYRMALTNLHKSEVNSVVSKKYREWHVALTYKFSYYLAMTYYCCGLVAEENKKRGEAVCYFENAADRLKEGWKSVEKISSDRSAAYKDAHAFTNEMITGKYKSAKRDNDSVYFEKVPALSSLPAIQGAIVAKSQAFDCQNPDVCGPDIFQKLVPMDIHLVVSEYSEEKAKVLREIIELTETKTRELDTYMNCAQLDRIPLSGEYLRLPRELLECCAALTTEPNLSKDLISAMQEINSQHHDVTAQLTELQQSLQALAETAASIKSTREFQDLQGNLKNIREMLSQANDSNTELHRHMTTIIGHLEILNSPLDQIEKSLPALTELNDEANMSKLARLALLVEKVETMKKQRETLVNDLRKKIQSDDITKLVLMHRQEDHQSLFSDQLKKHEELINTIKQNCVAQDSILQSLTEANAEVADIRTKMIMASESRQRLIQEYINSYKSIHDTLSKANEGIEFYKRQSVKLDSVRERLITLQSSKPVANAQAPAEYSAVQPSNEAPTIPDRPRLKDYLAARKPDSWGSTTSRPASHIEDNSYIAPSMSNINTSSNFYSKPSYPSSASLYSSMQGQVYTSLPTFNSYTLPPSIRPESAPMQYAPVQGTTSFQQPIYTHSYSYDQNFRGQPHPAYNNPATQPFPQQQFYVNHAFPPPQQHLHQTPLAHPVSHPPPSQAIPADPSMYQCQNVSDSKYPSQQSAPARFDPYRPRPVGAYDIPSGQQTVISSHPFNPQDIYRPGGLVGAGQAQGPLASYYRNGYDPNQFVQHIPASASVSSSFSNLSIN